MDRKSGSASTEEELIEFWDGMGWEQHTHTRDLQGPIPAKTGKKGQSHECGSAGFVGCCNWKINTGETWNLCGFHRFKGSLYLCCECFIYQKKSWNHRQDPKDPLIPWERTLATSPGGTFWNSRVQEAPGYSGIPGFRELLDNLEFQGALSTHALSLWECGSLDSEGSRKTIKAAGDPAASNTKGELKHY